MICSKTKKNKLPFSHSFARVVFIAFCISTFSLPGGCAPRSTPAPKANAPLKTFPAFPAGKEIESGIVLHEIALPMGGGAGKIWVYLPKSEVVKTEIQIPPKKLPCVLIGPAGTSLFHGMKLGEGDRPEHLPYVRAGFAVVSYELSGPIAQNPTDAQVISGAKNFYAAKAGVLNAQAALDYISARVPQIDAKRIYSAGHSSAGTLSLLVAQNDARIKACIAYAPITDLPKRLGEEFLKEVGPLVAPDYRAFIARSSPLANAAKLKVPVFLFHASDDDRVKPEAIDPFVKKLKTTNSKVTFVRVKSGGHYDSMMDEGVPQAIEWLQKFDAQKVAGKP